MNVLITGGNGFIGTELAELLHKDYRVTIIDRNTDNQSKTLNIKYINEDLQNFEAIKPFFQRIDAVFHMAADISIEDSIEKCREVATNNYISTLNVLELCKINQINRCIFSSTAAVYKDKKCSAQYLETDTTYALNPYSASKLACEILCQTYSEVYNIDTIILRYFNVFGVNTRKKKYKSVLPSFIENKTNNKPLIIYGDGKQTRDFVHVQDVANANLCAMKCKEKFSGEIFNIGSGRSVSIKQIADSLSTNISFKPEKHGEIKFSCANIEKAQKILNWGSYKPIIDWIKNNYG
jgi:UDP-glucose 4-epimerase